MGDQPRALISAHDKTGVVKLAAGLIELGWQLLASVGTAEAIAAEGLAVVDVADHVGSKAILGHRVVTLHPRIHGGILADRDDPQHRVDLEASGIDTIDLVVVNLYPFMISPAIETIDIGGPAMLRAAAKNHAHVGVLVDPVDYEPTLAELRARGHLSDASRQRLAGKAFAYSAAYESAIACWFNQSEQHPSLPDAAGSKGLTGPTGSSGSDIAESAASGVAGSGASESAVCGVSESVASSVSGLGIAEPTASGIAGSAVSGVAGSELPAVLHLELELAELLRYGENPHQLGARYRRRGHAGFFDRVIRRAGPVLSYLNLMDAEAAWHLAHQLGDRPAAVIVKHANPCGVSVADDLKTAYSQAYECDPRSAFGGVVAVNTVIDASTADAMVAAAQVDVVISPGYEPGVIERLAARRANTRLLEAPTIPPDRWASMPHPDRTPVVEAPANPTDNWFSTPHPHLTPTLGAATNPRGSWFAAGGQPWGLRTLGGAGGDYLVQTPQHFGSDPDSWQVVTDRVPTAEEKSDAVLAWRVCARTNSNAVVLARGGTAWGIGAGQQNRVEACQLAVAKAAGRVVGGACASDAFMPFADSLHTAADAGVAVVVQPGGSKNDRQVIAAANERNLAMLFTAERQFRH